MPRPRTIAALSLALSGALPAQDDAAPARRIQQALERARPALIRALRATNGNPSSLICLAARHDGMGSTDRPFTAAVARLARLRTSGTYAPALRLMLAADYPEFPNRDRVARADLAKLLSHQAKDGGFGYVRNTSYWDLSNTQYAALGLRAAVGLGLEVPPDTWRRLRAATLRAQAQDDGGFGYHRRNEPATATLSMTVAGITVLEICQQHATRDAEAVRAARVAIDRAWTWITRHRDRIGERHEPNCLYSHWGLERAAILSNREHVGEVDWYDAGAGMLLEMQRTDGAFRSSTDSHGKKAHTAFAVLFLRRKFQRQLPPPHPLTGPRTVGDDDQKAGRYGK